MAKRTPRRRSRRWTPELVLQELRQLDRRRVRLTSYGLLDAGHTSRLGAVQRHCGSLVRARRLAGIPDPEPRFTAERQRWDDDTVIHEIRRRRRQNLTLAPTKVPRTLYWAAQEHCGGWQDA